MGGSQICSDLGEVGWSYSTIDHIGYIFNMNMNNNNTIVNIDMNIINNN